MEDAFKIPSTDTKIKFIPRKSAEKVNSSDKDSTNQSSTATTADDPNNEINSEEATKDEVKISKTKEQNFSKPSFVPKQTPLPKCKYIEPKWSDVPDPELNYNFEVLKNGRICEVYKNLQTKPYWLIGKFPSNNIVMAHPTISRYHAVLQYRPDLNEMSENEEKEDVAEKPKVEKGWFLYDLASTHGSFVNKKRIPPNAYVRIRVGYVLKFGASTRCFILNGPEFDSEPESELSLTEIKDLRRKREEEQLEKIKLEELRKEQEGVSWGMGEDADEETDLSVNPFAQTNNEELFLNDPKKTLRGYFEREGYDLDYKVDEMSPGTFVCRIELPLSDDNGRPIIAEICLKGKKKDCVHQCALEACRILDRHGVLRQATHESRKRKIEHSDSDGDDDFYDRTGDVERKRLEKEANNQNAALSYDELLKQDQAFAEQLVELENEIEKNQELEKLQKLKQSKNDDDLDDFMTTLSKKKSIDKTTIRKLRIQVQRINADRTKLQRLINIARPIDLPPLKLNEEQNEVAKKTKMLPLFGKRGTYKFSTVTPTATTTKTKVSDPKTDYKSDEEEIEDVEEKVEQTVEEEKVIEPTRTLDLQDVKDPPIRSSKLVEPEPEKSKRSSTDYVKENKLDDDPIDTSSNSSAKKKRSRIRIRGGRSNVDIDDSEEIENTEKYSTWVPPENQTGDGSTNLNDKYGY